jgi:DNA-binding transcriptional ArsR family regulator
MNESEAIRILAALAQPSRLAVFRALVAAGHDGAFPGELSERLQIPPPTLSFHLKTLAHAGLVQREQESRHARYRANFARMSALMAFLGENCCGGDPAACGLPAASVEVALPVPALRKSGSR